MILFGSVLMREVTLTCEVRIVQARVLEEESGLKSQVSRSQVSSLKVLGSWDLGPETLDFETCEGS